MRKLVRRRTDQIKRPGNVRGSHSDLSHLRESLDRLGQQVPLIIDMDDGLLDGNRRLDCGYDPADWECLQTDESVDDAWRRRFQVEIDLTKKKLTPPEISRALIAMEAEEPDALAKELAARIGMTPDLWSKYGAAKGLCPEGWAAYEAGLPINRMVKLARMSHAEQRHALAPKEGERESKIKIPLADGLVVVTADDYDAAAELLKAALKALAKAKDQGLSEKTAMRAWKDMAAN